MTDNTNEMMLSAWEEFKSTNDARLAEIEKRNSADALTEEKLARIDASIEEIKTAQTEAAKKANRVSGQDEAVDEYKSAWLDYMRNPESAEAKAALQQKSMSIGGTGTVAGDQGGFTVPSVVNFNIIEQLLNYSPMRGLATVQPVSTSDYSVLLSNSATTTEWVDESEDRDVQTNPTISKLAVPFGEQSSIIPVTRQLLEDSAIDLEAWLTEQFAKAFGKNEGAAFINGTGTKQPKGILASGTGIGTVISGTAALVDKPDALITLVYSLKAGHRSGASFLMNSLTEANIRKLKDTTNNYLWAPGLNGGPANLLGYAVHNDENMPDIAANSLSIAFGNFKSGYIIADRVGIQVMPDPYTSHPLVNFKARARVGGRVTDPEAIKLLKTSAT